MKVLFIHIPRTGGTSMERRDIFNQIAQKYSTMEYCKKMAGLNPSMNFDDYFKFAFVRNPYDRFASGVLRYSMVIDKVPKEKFSEYVVDSPNVFEKWRTSKPMHPYLTIDGKLDSMDFIGRYENIQEDWSKVCKIMGVPDDLPHMNKSGYTYENIYTDEARELVYEYYKKDFEMFNYDK